MTIIFIVGLLFIAIYLVVFKLLGLTVIGSDEVAVIEKWWSTKGNLAQGKLISLDGEAGFQPDMLRAGIHLLPRFMFRVHKFPMIVIPQGQIGYVFARDGQAMKNTQLLGREVECSNFQDTRAFLKNGGQKGPQRAILREGAYAINLAQFIVITKNQVFSLPGTGNIDLETINSMKSNISSRNGFEPVVIKEERVNYQNSTRTLDLMGIVTVHEGRALPSGEIIAPTVGDDSNNEDTYHNSFQTPEAFLNAGGYKGKQEQVIADGTYYINRLFATVEIAHKTVVPMGYTAVVNSFAGEEGEDISGSDYKHGELVEKGCKGIWAKSLQPGKYAINTQAMSISLVPTTNIILKWEKGTQGDHNFDSNLKEVTLITKDAFEPTLPLSVVIHIDYKKAPYVIQRFGDIKKLVEQSLDPMVSAYFKNTAQQLTLIELIQKRANIQEEATSEMRAKFEEYNLNLVEVLIGTPSSGGDDKIEEILNQLTERQIAKEEIATFESKMESAKKKRELEEQEAIAKQQEELTKSDIAIRIQENIGKAELQKAEQDALKTQKLADAKAYERIKLADAKLAEDKKSAEAKAYETEALAKSESQAKKDIADANAYAIKQESSAEAESIELIGKAQAISVKENIDAYGDNGADYIIKQEVISKVTDAIKENKTPLVPQNYVSLGGGNNQTPNGMDTLNGLLALTMSEKMGMSFNQATQDLENDLEKDLAEETEFNHDCNELGMEFEDVQAEIAVETNNNTSIEINVENSEK